MYATRKHTATVKLTVRRIIITLTFYFFNESKTMSSVRGLECFESDSVMTLVSIGYYLY